MTKAKTREQVTNIPQPVVERIGEAVLTVGKVTIKLRALTFWERKYTETLRVMAQGMKYDKEGELVDRGDATEGIIAMARMATRLGITSIEGMPVETEKVRIAGRELELVTEATVDSLPDEVIEQLSETIQIITSLAMEEKIKLDFFTQSAEETGPSAPESSAEAASKADSP